MAKYKFKNGSLVLASQHEEDAYPIGKFIWPPTAPDGYQPVEDGYHVVDGKWVNKWKMEKVVETFTYDDYNRAIESHLYETRCERGYDEREPSPHYDNSKVARWRTDAKDYREFRDDVMLYALPVLNEYKKTGKAPTLEEFKAGFPKITWSYTEEM